MEKKKQARIQKYNSIAKRHRQYDIIIKLSFIGDIILTHENIHIDYIRDVYKLRRLSRGDQRSEYIKYAILKKNKIIKIDIHSCSYKPFLLYELLEDIEYVKTLF
jgi:hypothetical protein